MIRLNRKSLVVGALGLTLIATATTSLAAADAKAQANYQQAAQKKAANQAANQRRANNNGIRQQERAMAAQKGQWLGRKTQQSVNQKESQLSNKLNSQ